MTIRPERTVLLGAAGNRLVGDLYSAVGDEPHPGTPVLLLHGGGQTRHAWAATAEALAAAGFSAVALDQRGHGESDWLADKAYAFEDFAADLVVVSAALADRFGTAPIVVGASLGGISALVAWRKARKAALSALVLVDITPRMEAAGVAKVQGFMAERMDEGFESLEEAADAIAAYLPHRPRPKSLAGLAKNMREGPDGRYRWHWDPAFISGPRPVGTGGAMLEEDLVGAARGLSVPTLLVRGALSELVSEEAARHFLELVPHARFVDVSGAAHMVAGDRNDAFRDAVLDFVATLGETRAVES